MAAVEHERVLPAVKHVGEVAKTYFLRQAVASGFDDAAFVDRRGRLIEGIHLEPGLLGGGGGGVARGGDVGQHHYVHRPPATGPARCPQRVQEITLTDLPSLAGAMVMNSWMPGVAVRQIALTSLPEAPSFVRMLHQAYEGEPFSAP
ncbi:hypothetical protein [Nonomuraea sp. NPDC048826]|uniref:hypothetical protein n=1 Tax=Nonomuraea sp. NPDC048826 TaxID=3364347 RepID=UPI003720D41C